MSCHTRVDHVIAPKNAKIKISTYFKEYKRIQSSPSIAFTMSKVPFRLTLGAGKYEPFSKRKKTISRDYSNAEAGLGDKDFKAIVTKLEDIKEGMRLMNEKIA